MAGDNNTLAAVMHGLSLGNASLVFGAAYAVWYMLQCQTPELTCKDESFLEFMRKRCPALNRIYFPTFWAPTAFAQIVITGLGDTFYNITPSPYACRDIIRMLDGQDVAVDWYFPPVELVSSERIVVVLCHGAFQSAHSSPMVSIARHCASLGYPVAVVNRRGYGLPLSSRKAHLFGSDEDMDGVLLNSVLVRFPGYKVAIGGFSCGSMNAARYVCNRTRDYENGQPPRVSQYALDNSINKFHIDLPTILCGISLDHGFDCTDEGAAARMQFPVREMIGLLFYLQYIWRYNHLPREGDEVENEESNNEVTSAEGASVPLNDSSPESQGRRRPFKSSVSSNGLSALMRGRIAVHMYRQVRENSDVYCGNPDNWNALAQPDFKSCQVPYLVINSHDDPVLVIENATLEMRQELMSNPKIIHAEFLRGGHGTKGGFLGVNDVVPEMIAQFVDAAAAYTK